MIDTNVYLSHWPCRHLPDGDPARLVARLHRHGITRAYACHFDAILHHDLAGVNARTAEICAAQAAGILVPVGAVNPTLPDWKEDLRRCVEDHAMPAIRIFPNYHGYTLDDDRFVELLDRTRATNCCLQIPLMLEDERTQHPLLRVDHVDPRPLLELLADRPDARVMLLNVQRAAKGELPGELATHRNVSFDIAMLEQVAGIERFMKLVPYQQIVFGSFAPMFSFESAHLKLRESELGQEIATAITSDNAGRWLGRAQ